MLASRLVLKLPQSQTWVSTRPPACRQNPVSIQTVALHFNLIVSTFPSTNKTAHAAQAGAITHSEQLLTLNGNFTHAALTLLRFMGLSVVEKRRGKCRKLLREAGDEMLRGKDV